MSSICFKQYNRFPSQSKIPTIPLSSPGSNMEHPIPRSSDSVEFFYIGCSPLPISHSLLNKWSFSTNFFIIVYLNSDKHPCSSQWPNPALFFFRALMTTRHLLLSFFFSSHFILIHSHTCILIYLLVVYLCHWNVNC